jgi:hypothetical protein
MTTFPESVRLTARERRQLRGIERGLDGRSGTAGRLLRAGLDATTLALLAASIFVDLPWLFAGFVAGNLAACLHLDRRTRRTPC